MALRLSNISKRYDYNVVFDKFDITFKENVISCILGPSGCGKTTLLNIMGNVVVPDSGAMEGLANKRLSYIFQTPRLLPWKTVADNIDFVLDRKIASSKRKERVKYFLNLVELTDYADLYPHQLSGGMSQRVSIARAFAVDSDIILMDEPFSALDVTLKSNIIERFLNIWASDKRTIIFVTHDIDEALTLSNEIFVFSKSPVTTLLHKEIYIPFSERNNAHPFMQEVKNDILRHVNQ